MDLWLYLRGISLLKILQNAALFDGLMRKDKDEWGEWCLDGAVCVWSYTRVVECWCGSALLLWLGTGVVEGAGTGG